MNLAPEIERLASARTLQQVDEAIDVACRELGFRWGSGFGATPLADGGWDFRRFGLVPESFQEMYVDAEDYRRDPVMQHVKRSAAPLLWDRQTYERAGRMAMWESQAAHGVGEGITACLHLPGRQGLVFGFEGHEDLSKDKRLQPWLLERFSTFHAHLEQSFSHVIGWPNPGGAAAVPKLTARELECLRWAAEGKTHWEIGQLLGISERTVKKHVEGALVALNCVNKTHAVARAIRLRLI